MHFDSTCHKLFSKIDIFAYQITLSSMKFAALVVRAYADHTGLRHQTFNARAREELGSSRQNYFRD